MEQRTEDGCAERVGFSPIPTTLGAPARAEATSALKAEQQPLQRRPPAGLHRETPAACVGPGLPKVWKMSSYCLFCYVCLRAGLR